MKTTCFTLLFSLGISLAIGQVITQEATSASIWVWSIQGQATYQEIDFKMAQPLPEGKMLSTQANIWVSNGGHVVLLYNGTSTSLGSGVHNMSAILATPSGKVASGFTQSITPEPATGGASNHGNDGSGFGQSIAPEPAPSGRQSGRGDEGSGFSQGIDPAPAPSGSQSGRGNDGSGFGSGDDSVPPSPGTNTGGSKTKDLGDGIVPVPDENFLKWIFQNRDSGGSGFGQGVPPAPASSGQSGLGDEGSGFGQGVPPAPAPSGQSRLGNEGSGFSQGIDPAPAPSGSQSGRGNEGSGFGQGVPPAPAPSGQSRLGNEGSGFGQGVPPAPAPSGQSRLGNEGSGFGDGVTPDPDLGQTQPVDRVKDGTGHSPVVKVEFDGGYNGFVTPGPVYYRWTQPGDNQTCQFKIWSKDTPAKPVFQTNTVKSGITVDLGEMNLKMGSKYVASISLLDGEVIPSGKISFSLVGPEVQLQALEKAMNNSLYSSGSSAHQSILNAMELEQNGLLTAATAYYQKAYSLNPYSQFVQAMIFTYKKKYGMISLD